jgi:hypothetical protein
MSQYWSNNDVRTLFHRLIHTVAVKGHGILADKNLEEVREYIKSTEEVINNELVDAMYECRNSGKPAKQEIALRYHNLTGCTMQESRDFAEVWIAKAKQELENTFKRGTV